MPTHTHALTGLPSHNTRANGIDYADDFMTRNSWVFQSRQKAFFDDCIAMADSAGLNLNPHQSGTSRWNLTFDKF
jgi:hypothetical protein